MSKRWSPAADERRELQKARLAAGKTAADCPRRIRSSKFVSAPLKAPNMLRSTVDVARASATRERDDSLAASLPAGGLTPMEVLARRRAGLSALEILAEQRVRLAEWRVFRDQVFESIARFRAGMTGGQGRQRTIVRAGGTLTGSDGRHRCRGAARRPATRRPRRCSASSRTSSADPGEPGPAGKTTATAGAARRWSS